MGPRGGLKGGSGRILGQMAQSLSSFPLFIGSSSSSWGPLGRLLLGPLLGGLLLVVVVGASCCWAVALGCSWMVLGPSWEPLLPGL